jgi:serine/threonine protein kinase
MEAAPLGDLSKYLETAKKEKLPENKYLKESKILSIILQICLGLSKVHDKGFIHRDIKDKNILMFENGIIKI